MAKRWLLANKNLADAATLSGGDWSVSYPLTLMQNRDLARAARSQSLEPAATVFVVDHGDSKYKRLFFLGDTNISPSAQIRVTSSMDPSFTTLVYDSGFFNFYDAIYTTDSLEWEDDNWFYGTPSDDDLEGTQRNLYHVTDENVASRYDRIEVYDPENPDGFVRIARLLIMPVWQFAINPSYGANIAFESNTLVDKSMDNVAYFDERTPNRVMRFTLEYMDEEEAFTRALELDRKSDVHGEIVFVPDYENPTIKFRLSIYGRLRQLSALEMYAFGTHRKAFEIEGLI